MNTRSIYEIDMNDDKRINIIESNKNAEPLDKIIQLTEEPWVSIQGEGTYSGQHFCFIRVSYCPLSCKFCDIKISWTDKGKSGKTVRDLVNWAKLKYMTRVCITGGEPLYKYDDETVHLVKALQDAGKAVHIETSGICTPNVLMRALNIMESNDEDFMWNEIVENEIPEWITVSPKYRDCVKEEDQSAYLFYMVDQMKFWRRCFESSLVAGEWKFVVDCNNTEQDLFQIIWLIQEIYDGTADFKGAKFIFQPETRSEIYNTPLGQRTPEHYFQYLKDWSNLTKEVGRVIPNFPNAEVHIMSQSHQLLNYR